MPQDAVAAIGQRRAAAALPWMPTLQAAAALTGIFVFLIIIGLFGQFVTRWLVVDMLDIGHALLLSTAMGVGAVLARRYPSAAGFAAATAAGAIAGAALALLVAAAQAANLRWMFVSLSPPTLLHVAYGYAGAEAAVLLACAAAAAAALGAATVLMPSIPRRVVLGALGGVAIAGLLRELIRNLLGGFGSIGDWAISYDGLLPTGAAAAAAIGILVGLRPGAQQYAAMPRAGRLGVQALLLIFLLLLPALTNDFVAQVMMLVGLYTLMSLGLNVELGLAGLVDLGFVAFFAVGAYTVGLLTSDTSSIPAHFTFFQALPFAVILAAVSGFFFGLPVLKVRGDYLAIATLGLGEIIRVLVLSDMLKPLLGGAQGIVNIPKPSLFGLVLASPTRLFYLTAFMAAIAGYCAWRLQHSGLGRRWLAVREDEDVAQALGIHLVQVKLSAYTLGAAFAGLAGGIFAAMTGSVFPQSFQLLVSVNVLAILVVGGIGSLPGVLIGAATLIGGPEVLRDLGEYRYLIYGLVIIAVVRLKPDGLSPKAIRNREAV